VSILKENERNNAKKKTVSFTQRDIANECK
jgi:hypothetical protein